MSKGITLDDLKGMDIPSETLENPNLKPKNGGKKIINPAKEFGLPSQKELDAQDSEKQGLVNQAYPEMDKVIERKTQEAIKLHELEEQGDGELTYQDYVDAHNGFDPLAMMENPPKLGVSREVREENARREAEAEQRRKEMEAYEESVREEETSEQLQYEGDDIDPEAADKAIINSIPDEDDLEEQEILADMEAEDDIEKEIESEVEGPHDSMAEGNYIGANTQAENSYAEGEAEKIEVPAENEDNKDIVENHSKVLYDLPDDITEMLHRDEDADLEALDADTAATSSEEETNKRRLEYLKKDAISKITPVTSAFNLSQFTISTKPISMNAVTASSKESFQKCADWALFHSKRPITMRSFRGSEIANLLKDSDRNRLAAAREMYGIIHDHVVDPNKPENVDDWLKTIKVADVDNLYAGVYRSSFEGQNFLPYDCPDDKCANSFLSNSIPFMDMVKFKDDKTKEEFMKIYNSAPTVNTSTKIDIDLVPVSDNCVIGFKEPSIYDAVIMPAYLDDAFINKYNDMITLSTCVEQIFFIDRNANELKPISIKEYKNDPKKSLKAKIITLAKIMKELTSDQYQLVRIYVEKLTGMESVITFKIPAVNCPKCGKEIEESEYSAAQMVFIRHHLASLVNG